ncbi:MAG: MotA/TolQ/ExbB proton channel family protein [Methyloversatilis discipulorum]|uniref:MotA/TolQ/ExbB proton channel family protein n=1 Tax=Methyloversatilis discipulorum TaxID=1119528 RepID=UPI0026F29C45|nr:MotA/TolQ/ExbB proton channel family protein [Methyloversatilis discipulorum]MBT9516009.1 MotA/TolQ/ExbB proton channel family protein [Methyloversatilis discipulorum]
MSLFSSDIEIPTTLLVESTLWVLVAFSVATWTLILIKGIQNWRIGRQNRLFRADFWHAPNLQAAAELGGHTGPIARLAQAGFASLADADRHSDLEHSGDRQDQLERALRQQYQKERRGLEAGLAVLASIGSTAPFVGLFGTVWGIMQALVDIGKTGSASLEVVAGPIGEALIATGVGIAVAVPAVLAYNVFLRRVKAVSADIDDFSADLINLSRRAGFRIGRSAADASTTARPADPRATQGVESPALREVFA